MDDYDPLSQLALINPGFGDLLLISFSGGKTSAYVTWMILNKAQQNWKEVIVVFANTGQENEQTLEFVDKCDRFFGFKTVWVETKVNQEKGKGTIHKVVSFDTASRLGEPFESVISK